MLVAPSLLLRWESPEYYLLHRDIYIATALVYGTLRYGVFVYGALVDGPLVDGALVYGASDYDLSLRWPRNARKQRNDTHNSS